MTGIPYCTDTLNFTSGCEEASGGCANCWAVRDAWRMAHHPNRTIAERYENIVKKDESGRSRWTGDLNVNPDVLLKVAKWKRPRVVFVNSNSDLFWEKVSYAMTKEVFAACYEANFERLHPVKGKPKPPHIFLFLTKRPAIMAEYWNRYMDEEHSNRMRSSLEPFWFGISAEDNKHLLERWELLATVRSPNLFLSLEPMLSGVDLYQMIDHGPCGYYCTETHGHVDHRRPSWVIFGGESGPGARPMHPDWIRKVRNQCEEMRIPFLFKRWGEWWPGYPQYDDTDPVVNGDQAEDLKANQDWCAPIEVCLENTGFMPCGYDSTVPKHEQADWCHNQPDQGLNPWWMGRIGKKAAGRELDGRTHDGMPAPIAAIMKGRT